MPKQPERIYQARFDEHLQFVPPKEVTPPGSAGLEFQPRDEQLRSRVRDVGRFVREVKEAVQIRSPADAAHHLLTGDVTADHRANSIPFHATAHSGH